MLDGSKRWIGNGTIADVIVVWARDTEDGEVKGFLVEKGAPGFRRAGHGGQGLAARGVAGRDRARGRAGRGGQPAAGRADSFDDCAEVLAATRSLCAWMALGHAVAGFDAAMDYAARREQFGKPLHQLPARAAAAGAHARRRHRDAALLRADGPARRAEGTLEPTLAGLAKLHNTSQGPRVLAEARDLLGGNGVLLDFHVIRHMLDIEAIHTFEGTETMQTLIVGRDITGVSAFT